MRILRRVRKMVCVLGLVAGLGSGAAVWEKVATDQPVGVLETVATFSAAMPTGVTVSHGNRIFVNFPRWGDDVPFTVAGVVNGEAVADPPAPINKWPGLSSPPAHP